MTFPRNVGQVPIYYNYKNTGRPKEEPNVFWSHYIDSKNTPLYPFGHGLSYTTFEYSNFKIYGNTFNIKDTVKVTVDLKNTGKFDGKEVVQLYIRDLVGSVTRPVRELKGFELVNLEKGESKTIEFNLSKKELGFYNNEGEHIIEAGKFQVFIGGSSTTTLEKEFELTE